LTEPGLGGIVACIKEGRSAFQRVLTYTLTILINKCVTLIVLGAGLIITGHAVLTPLLQALSMLTNDFVTIMLVASLCDVLLVASLAAGGVLMSPLPKTVIAVLAPTTIIFTLAMDSIKIAVYAHLRID
jgi:magnesium-transporting ATPase (P-type)